MKITEELIRTSPLNDFVYEANQAVLYANNGDEIMIEMKNCDMKRDFSLERFIYMTNNDFGLKSIAFPIINKKNLVIDGKGARLNGIGRVLPFYITGSENITIKNFVIDYIRPMFSQGEIIEVSQDSLVLKIDKDKFPYKIKNGILVFVGEDYEEEFVHGMLEFDKETKRPLYDTIDISVWNPLIAEELPNGNLKVFYTFRNHIPRVGNLLSIKHERRYVPAIAIDTSKNIILENINIYHAGTMGVVAQFSENITLDNVKVVLENGTHRVVSANADATHFVGCTGELLIQNCRFENQLDDSINIHGNYLRVIKVLDNNKVIAQIPHRQQVGVFGLKVDSKLTLHHDKTMLFEGEVILEDFKIINNKYCELKFKQAFNFKPNMEYCIENADAYPNVVVKNSIFGKNRARSILLTGAKNILIEGNTIDSEGAVFKISGDMDNWYESGATNNIIIRNNIVKRSNIKTWGKAVFDIDPEMEEFVKDRYFHNSILVEDNEIHLNNFPLVYGQSFKELKFIGNKFIVLEDDNFTEKTMPMDIHNYGKVVFENNKIVIQ